MKQSIYVGKKQPFFGMGTRIGLYMGLHCIARRTFTIAQNKGVFSKNKEDSSFLIHRRI
jgi:hypothetical protein